MRAAVLIALALLTLLAPTAEASFPGRNGDLLVTDRVRSHGWFDVSALLTIDPSSGASTRTVICAESALGESPQPQCFWTGPPSASPDGRSVAFAGQDAVGGPPHNDPQTASLRVLSLATGDWTLLPLGHRTLPYETIVRWTPDASFVVLANRHRVLLAGPDGSNRGRLVANASAPAVSSSGRLAFVRDENVHVLKADGSARRLTGRGGDQPSWSPRGKSIAFTRKGYVYTVRARGGPARRLTRGFHPVWSPDGKQIAFFRAIPDPAYFGEDTTYLFALDRRTGRVRRVSPRVMAVPDDVPPNGLDWQVAR